MGTNPEVERLTGGMTGKLREGILWNVKATIYYRKRPGRPFACFFVGWASLLRGSEKAADRYFDEALAVSSCYIPAIIGKIAVRMRRGLFREAQKLLEKEFYQFQRKIDLFRLGSMISICMDSTGQESERKPGAKFFGAGLWRYLSEVFMEGYGKNSELELDDRYFNEKGQYLMKYLNLIRFIKSVSNNSSKNPAYQRTLAINCCDLPGICDETRVMLIQAACGGVTEEMPGGEALDEEVLFETLNKTAKRFVLDNPVIIPIAFVDSIFQHAIMNDKLERAETLLYCLYMKVKVIPIQNKNKWRYLYLCHRIGRKSDGYYQIADELRKAGWWADPLVKKILAIDLRS